jgi:hypothetical protein
VRYIRQSAVELPLREIESAEFLKSRNPNCEVTVKDLRGEETTVIAFKPERS